VPVQRLVDRLIAARFAWFASLAAAVGMVFVYTVLVPLPRFNAPYSWVLESSSGRMLSALIATDGQWRFPPVQALPWRFKEAIIAQEDRRFYSHIGVDAQAVMRALIANLSSGEIQSGASTITMQLVRLSRGNPPRTLGEKLVEGLLALRTDLGMSKDEILAMYAAHAPFGGNVVGLEAASWRYFGRSPTDLSWAESATLAVLPNSPGLIHVGRKRDVLKSRRDALLQALHKRSLLDDSDLAAAMAEPLPEQPLDLPMAAPHYIQFLRSRESLQGKPADDNHRFASSIDYALQQKARAIAAGNHERLAGNGIMNLSALILRVEDGAVLAYVGNSPALSAGRADPAAGGDNDMVQAWRSTGSLLKPFLYAAMIDAGELLPTQLVADVPTRFGSYAPENNTRTYEGAVPASEALFRSLNIPAARMLKSYGLDRFYRLLKDLGMTSLFRSAAEYGLPLVLGGAESSLWEMCRLYRDAARQLLTNVEQVDYPLGKPALYQMFDALLNVVRPGEESSWEQFASSAQIAWKTGTSFGYRDAWAIGTDGRHVVGVWAGNASGQARPELRGYSAAAPMLFELFSTLPEASWFVEPESEMIEMTVCADSGYPAGPDCARQVQIRSSQRSQFSTLCPYCTLLHLEPSGQYLASSECTNPLDMKHEKRFLLPPFMEYYYRSRHADYRGLPARDPACAASRNNSGNVRLNIFSPALNSTLYIPVELDGKPGRTVCQAAHSRTDALLYWHLDGEFVGHTRYPHTLSLRPAFGEHLIMIVDGEGNESYSNFSVLSR